MPNIGDIIKATDLQDLLEQINNSSSNIVGELKYFGFNEVPEHCLMCDGSEISRETYHELFEKYGTIYGEGDGSTTFNLPDYRGAFFRCIGGNAAELGVEQGDAIRNMIGGFSIHGATPAGTGIGSFQIGTYGICFGTTNQSRYLAPSGVASAVVAWGTMNIDVSRAVPTADENRPINYAVNICVVYE